MKAYLILLIATPLFSLLSTFNNTEQFIGKWVAEDKGEIGYINFDKDGYASFEINGQILGGRVFEFNGEKGSMTYVIDDTKTPIAVDFIVTKLESGEKKTLHCIAKFIDENTMEFALGFDDKRPIKFDEHAVLLRRLK